MSDSRPLSPHLQVYQPQITSVLSILHRATGVALSVGLLCFVFWLASLAQGPDAYASTTQLLTGPLGLVVLSGWIVAFYYHLANGIRHLAWDAGYGFEMPTVRKSGWFVVFFTFVSSAFTIAILLWRSLG